MNEYQKLAEEPPPRPPSTPEAPTKLPERDPPGTLKLIGIIMWKNYRMMLRYIWWTFFEMGLPLLCFFGVSVLTLILRDNEEYISEHHYQSYPLRGTHEDFFNVSVHPCPTWNRTYNVFYTPKERGVDVIMKNFARRFVNSKYRFRARSLEDHLTKIPEARRNSSIYIMPNNKEGCERHRNVMILTVEAASKNRLTYEVRLNRHREKQIVAESPFIGHDAFDYPPDRLNEIYPFSSHGYIVYQAALENAYLQVIHNDTTKLRIQSFSVPKHVRQHYAKLLMVMKYAYMFMAYLLAIHTASAIAREKESGMKNFLFTIGMTRFTFFTGHILTSFIKCFISFLLNIIPIFVIMEHMNPIILVMTVTMYGFAIICTSAFIGALVRSSSTGLKATMLFMALSYYVHDLVHPDRSNIPLCIALSAVPYSAFRFVLDSIADDLSRRDDEVTFSRAFYSERNEFPFGAALVAQAIYSVLFLVLTPVIDWLLYSNDSIMPSICSRQAPPPVCRSDMIERTRSLSVDLRLTEITKKYPGRLALNGLTLDAYRGQVTCVIGPSGAGKSTFFGILSGLIRATSGRMEILQHDVTENNYYRHMFIGFCPQANTLFAGMTCREHLWLVASIRGVPRQKRPEEIKKLLAKFHLRGKGHWRAKQLSAGEQRKLCAAMALVGDCPILLFDEPTAGMDPVSRKELIRIIKEIKQGRTILYTTHNMNEAEDIGDRIAFIGNGRVVTVGTSTFLRSRFNADNYYMSLHGSRNNAEKCEKLVALSQKSVSLASLHDHRQEVIDLLIPSHDIQHFPELLKDIEEKKEELHIGSIHIHLSPFERAFARIMKVVREEAQQEVKASTESLLSVKREISSHNTDELIAMGRDDRIDGFPLFLQQLLALFHKRFLFTMSLKMALISQFLTPIACIIIYGAIKKLLQIEDSQDLNFTVLKAATIVVSNNSGLLREDKVARLLHKYTHIKTVVVSNIPQYVSKHLMSASPPIVGSFDITSTGITVGYNRAFRFSLPLMISFSSSYRMSMRTPDAEPITSKWTGVSDSDEFDYSSIAFACFFLYIILMHFVPFVYQPIVDRHSGFVHQQFLSRVSLLTYWLATYLYDLLFYVTGCSIFLATMFYSHLLSISRVLIAAMVLSLTFLPTVTFIYSLALIFHSYTAAQVIFNIYQMAGAGTGVICLSFPKITDFLPDGLEAVLRIFFTFAFPLFSLTDAIRILVNQRTTDEELFKWQNIGGIAVYLSIYSILAPLLFSAVQMRSLHQKYAFWQGKRRFSNPEMSNISMQMERQKLDEQSGSARNRNVLEVVNVRREMINGITLKTTTFFVARGECYGLLGTTGSGRSTLFSMITGELFPHSGYIRVNGHRVHTQIIGYCPQMDSGLPTLTGKQNIQIIATLQGYKKPKEVAQKMLKALNMYQFRHVKYKCYSFGQRRKISLGMALLAQSSLVVFDEATTGLDPQSREEIWEMIKKIRQNEGKAGFLVTFSSMVECEAICTKIALMKNGEMVSIGSKDSIKEQLGNVYRLKITLESKESRDRFVKKLREELPQAKKRPHTTFALTIEFDIPWNQHAADQPISALFEKVRNAAKSENMDMYYLTQEPIEDAFVKFAMQEGNAAPKRRAAKK